MSIRLYVLARELGVENNAVIDVCAKIGVKSNTNQGGDQKAEPFLVALSTLSDEDADRIRKFYAESR